MRALAIVCLLGLLAIGAPPSIASAQTPPPTPPADEALRQARGHERIAQAFIDIGSYKQALSAIEDARRAAPRPEQHYLRGEVFRRSGERLKAVEAYREFLAQRPDGPQSEEVIAKVVELVREIEEEKPRVVADTPPRVVDDAALPAAPAGPPPAALEPRPDRPDRRWLWGLIGGAAALVVAGTVVGLAVGLSGADHAPTIGTIQLP